MNIFKINDSEYYSIVRSIFSHELRKRRLLARWKELSHYLYRYLGNNELENEVEMIEKELKRIDKEEDTWSHLKDCIYLQVFSYIPQIKV